MTRLNETEQARCVGYLEAFQADLLTMIHSAWIKTGSPVSGAYVKSGKQDDIPAEGVLLPVIVTGEHPEFRIVHKMQHEERIIAAALVRCTRNNDYVVMGMGKLCDCTLLSEVIVKAKNILLHTDS